MPDLQHYVGNAEAFPILSKWDFFNHAGVCPLPRGAADAFRTYAAQAEIDAYLGGAWYKDIEKLRVLSAQLLNCHRDEIAFIKNTGEGLSIVANGIDFHPGDRIVTTAVEYPANIYPWMEQVRRRQCKLVMVPEETDPDGRRYVPLDRILAEAADPRTRLVTLSHVEFASGQRLDIAAVGRFCREHGKLFCVDAIQTLGALPVDVQAMGIDFLSADGHKWLLGPEGAGILYIRRELIESTPPLTIGWMNVKNAMDYGNYDYTLKEDASRYECGSYNVPGLLGLKASVELLANVGIDAVAKRLKTLTDHFIARVSGKGYQLLSPRNHEQWSGSVAFMSRRHDHQPIVAALRKEHRIEIALREGRLRCSPHFYNTEAQLDRLVEALPGH
ncbi:MAG TPA: aminotransferase class V-fold PLP-dependent enzyme [Tepidisphaeraceae bacterium]|jgi:cysteine desulfurase/selenocysteine lyase|nr:aminotransferase class V-fold PLP-dependent enzyme [Tepidisphaeraceae bacterium]